MISTEVKLSLTINYEGVIVLTKPENLDCKSHESSTFTRSDGQETKSASDNGSLISVMLDNPFVACFNYIEKRME